MIYVCGTIISLIHIQYLQVTTKPIVIYPNSGETYDADHKEWVVSSFHLVVLFNLTLVLYLVYYTLQVYGIYGWLKLISTSYSIS